MLRIANALWAQHGVAFQQPFLDVLAGEFGAGLELVDYHSDAEGARAEINAWVAAQTEDRIEELLGAGTITPDTRLTLVNAVYMKAPWQLPFERSATADQAFTRGDGSTVTAPMMHATRSMGYSTGGGSTAVELPYAGGGLSMLLVLPDESVAADAVELPGPGALPTTKVRLTLPRWDTETSVSLADALAALGMPTAFTDGADFSGMTTEAPLRVSDVVHQADITVDEYGTEAAAATAVMMAATSAPDGEPPSVVFDRPFLFAVRTTDTGAVLFQGHVADPTAPL